MLLGTQIRPRDDDDYRVWAQLGVTHVCVDPPGNPHDWTLGDLERQRAQVEKFGLSLDMVGKGNNGHFAPFAWTG